MTSVTSLGGNAYKLTLSGTLGYNNYIVSVASSSTVFGPAVTDANGAGIAGAWTNGSSTFPSGNGLAGSQFNFLFDLLPGDANQSGTTNSQDNALETSLVKRQDDRVDVGHLITRLRTSTPAGRSTQDNAVSTTDVNFKSSNITNPSNPSGGLAGGSGFTALALGVQESGSSSGSASGPRSPTSIRRVFRRPSPHRAARAAVGTADRAARRPRRRAAAITVATRLPRSTRRSRNLTWATCGPSRISTGV